MAEVFRLPKLGKSMKDGVIVASYVKEGDEVDLGDVVFEVETDKATLEVESSEVGLVRKILVNEGQTVFVDAPLLVVGDKDEKIEKSFIDGLIADLSSRQAGGPVEGFSDDIEPVLDEELLAVFLRVNLEAKAGGDTAALDEFRYLTGRRLLWSKRHIPCFYLSIEADVTDLTSRCDNNVTGGVTVLLEDYIIRGLAVALTHYPLMTGRLVEKSIEMTDDAGVGVAVEVSGVVLPVVVHDAVAKSVNDIAKCRSELVSRAREGKLEIADLEGGCITLSNAGVFGVDSYIPIVIGGQCSAFGVGRVKEKCVKSGGEVKVRKIVCLSLSVDHRIVNGAEAAQFLDSVKKSLENPEVL